MAGRSYMDDLAPNLRYGTELMGADQAAMQARSRRKGENCCSPYDEAAHQQRMKDWDALSKVSKRRDRGGQIFKRGDGLG